MALLSRHCWRRVQCSGPCLPVCPQRWNENFLHTNVLEPPLERDPFPWPERRDDFELYRTPLQDFGSTPVHTIMESGLKLKKERDDAKARDQETWKSKVMFFIAFVVVVLVSSYFSVWLPMSDRRDKPIN